MKRRPIPMLFLVAVAMVGTPFSLVLAQSQPPQEMSQPDKAANYSDGELKQYASAAVQVAEINRDYTSKLEAAGTPDQQQAIRKEATTKMAAVIRKEGLSVQKYNEIYNAASADPKLAQRLNSLIKKAQ